MTGKEKCKKLKAIRKSVADRMGVDLHQTECTWEGECKGTCPKCRQEEEILNAAIMRKGAALAGATVIATSLAACTPNGVLLGQRNGGNPGAGGDDGIEQLSGDVEYADDSDLSDESDNDNPRGSSNGDDSSDIMGYFGPMDDDTDGGDAGDGKDGGDDDDMIELSGEVAAPDDRDF